MQLVVIKVSNRQIAPQLVEGKLVVISPKLHRRSDKSRHFGVGSRSMMRDPEVLRYQVLPGQHAANS